VEKTLLTQLTEITMTCTLWKPKIVAQDIVQQIQIATMVYWHKFRDLNNETCKRLVQQTHHVNQKRK